MVKAVRKFWERISNTLGFTRQEQLIVLFLLFGLLLGSVVSITKKRNSKTKSNFEYSEIKKEFFERAQIVSQNLETERNSTYEIQRNHIRININTASQKELEKLPQIGPVLAKKIIEYRQTEGGFQSPQDLKKVRGIGEKVFAKIKPYVYVQ